MAIEIPVQVSEPIINTPILSSIEDISAIYARLRNINVPIDKFPQPMQIAFKKAAGAYPPKELCNISLILAAAAFAKAKAEYGSYQRSTALGNEVILWDFVRQYWSKHIASEAEQGKEINNTIRQVFNDALTVLDTIQPRRQDYVN